MGFPKAEVRARAPTLNLVTTEKKPCACFMVGVQMLIFWKGGAHSSIDELPQPRSHERSFPEPSLHPSWVSSRCLKVPATSKTASTLESSMA